MPENAREVAVRALGDRAGNVSAAVRRLVKTNNLATADKALAVELALGSLRRRTTLEVVLRAFLTQPDRPMPAYLRRILHVALYQILFLQRVPDYAAVNEAVAHARMGRGRSQAALVNAVLRSVLRELSPVIAGRAPDAVRAVPIGPGTYRTLKRPVFTDPAQDAAAYLAEAYSLPPQLAGRWLRQRGSLDNAVAIAAHTTAPAPLIVRVNSLKSSVAAAADALAADGVSTRRHLNAMSLVIDDPGDKSLTDLVAFKDGLIQPQDPTATAVALACGVKPAMKVLDFCAAPGTKTTHLAELMENKGSIVAADVSDEKLAKIESNCRRMGISIVSTLLGKQAGSLSPGGFDVVLADVPCSNTGVLARRAEARWRFSEQALSRLVKDQWAIVSTAAIFVRPGGRLIYSTCSIEPQECGGIARRLAKHHKRLTLAGETLTSPGGADDSAAWRDGGYYAVFEA